MGSLTDEPHGETLAFLKDLETGVEIERTAPQGIGQASVGYGGGGPIWLDAFKSKRPPTPSELVNSYKAVAFACIQLNANAVASVPLRLYCKTKVGQPAPRFWPTRQLNRPEREALMRRLHAHKISRALASDEDVCEIVDHPLCTAMDSPNPHFDGNMLIQFLVRTLDCIGTAYWYPERLGPGWAPTEIWPIHSQYCYPNHSYDGGIIHSYNYFGDQFQFEELIRFRNVSLRDPYLSGYAPLHACFEQLGLIDYYTAVVESTLKGGARPEAMIGPKDPKQPWTETERKRVESAVNSRFGRGNQGRIWTVDSSFDMQTLTYPPADLAGLKISKDARLLAANCFDVPISMLEAESSNKAVASEGASQHQRNAVTPRCALIAAALTHQVARRIDPRLFYAFDEAVQKDREGDAEIHDIYLRGGVLCPDEVRAELGREPRADGKGGEYRKGGRPPQERRRPRPGEDGEDREPEGDGDEEGEDE